MASCYWCGICRESEHCRRKLGINHGASLAAINAVMVSREMMIFSRDKEVSGRVSEFCSDQRIFAIHICISG